MQANEWNKNAYLNLSLLFSINLSKIKKKVF